MKILQLFNKQRQPLGQITWEPPDCLHVEIQDAGITAEITALVEQVQHEGLSLRSGAQVEKDGHKIFVEQKITVKPDDERFLPALTNAINRKRFIGQRVFALLQEVKETDRAVA